MENKLVRHFVLKNDISELAVFSEKLSELAEEWGIPMALTMNLNLVMEEALSNVIFYAFKDNLPHDIKIAVALDQKILTFKITDSGIAFDPTRHKQPDISLPAEERPIGGLGILLILKNMDSVHYTRKKNQNILTLTKSI